MRLIRLRGEEVPDLLALREHRGTKIVDPRTFHIIMMNAESSGARQPWKL